MQQVVAERVGCHLVAAHDQVRVVGDPPQCHHHFQVLEQLHFALEPAFAVHQLFGFRLVVGRRAVGGRGDPGVFENQTIVHTAALGLRGKPVAIEGFVQEVARLVARKHAAGAIGPMRTGGEANNQQPGFGIAKRRHGLPPVVPIQIRPPLYLRDLPAMCDQTGASLTRHDLPIQSHKP